MYKREEGTQAAAAFFLNLQGRGFICQLAAYEDFVILLLLSHSAKHRNKKLEGVYKNFKEPARVVLFVMKGKDSPIGSSDGSQR